MMTIMLMMVMMMTIMKMMTADDNISHYNYNDGDYFGEHND